MSGYILSPAAQADIDTIWDVGEAKWGLEQAERYARQILRAIETVSADPRRGRRCDDIRAGYFKFAVGAHMLFYRPVGDMLDIVRVLHQRMDFPRHL
ncbi:type II toxin-antitoxin system RelE/ParE family toxin [Phenylobacterium sp.]|uniref:type II toxin-antitoxin system RelE/ParE family toxin n=1 Tax=Phenylobacterium sp. TaxID=1871053 RepID=UPI0025FA8001|nr:type II toxin-antitoxin system RelE/ParE family toxin [Phenylobacterium sp.]MBX3486250.1 type II toxin-antitoxin system RelE/ParE family toxin [Phenylobacterium sp.]MCW5760417.1 type II toxin-antitoxin system RelE/ParE family toxin [Phenylobacterium sp.]